jgi:hypothetical protein
MLSPAVYRNFPVRGEHLFLFEEHFMKYKIEHGTPLTPRGHTGTKRRSSTLSITETLVAMPIDPNSSFLVPLKDKKPDHVRGQICGAICALKKRPGYQHRKYATRYLFKQKGIRVWRLN